MAPDGVMKNRKKSRSGCRTCKARRLRCDETKPTCRNCTQKGLECPGYQQRLQWSTKHERPTATQTRVPANFEQLVSAASESIITGAQTTAKPSVADGSSPERSQALLAPVPIHSYSNPSRSPSPWPLPSPSSASYASSSSSSSSASSAPSPATLSPPPHYEDRIATGGPHITIVPADAPVVDSVVPKKEEPDQADDVIELPKPTLVQPVVNIPTFLIEHWFKSVCTSWSALDSPSNPYRRLTGDLWNSSPAVYYSLQSISAASLVERLPHVMRDTARTAPQLAFDAIKQELRAFYTGTTRRFPTELLLALFCMSSSMAWMEARRTGQELVRQARHVLRSLKSWRLDKQSQELLDFFNGCLVYEEMLRSVVSEDDIDFHNMLSWPDPTPNKALVSPTTHPWSGVSPDVLMQFGKAMALCRRSRTRWRLNEGTSYEILEGALQDIKDARRIEESLLPPDFAQLPQCQPPAFHCSDHGLHYITEAYRLCALLQLYETFPDLCTKRIPLFKDAHRSTIWHAWVSPLALHITDVLAKVPPSHLSCIQPLLCLCAGSGLRYESKVKMNSGENSYLILDMDDMIGPGPVPPTMMSGAAAAATAATTTSPSYSASTELGSGPSIPMSETTMRTSQACQFVMDRLDQLETCLPPKPIGVAKQLMREVWSVYDKEIGQTRRTHWLDVMSSTGLHTLFG
ncbi:hypothetical protein VTJ83DRAFT_4536 [Remersonia thermophila]|uniref:Zn(2)-C6 fungal-type domain-containing protein n=1 Tax=Remersonia thermophila TaxID=72144 RepID=A0ABR4DB51_9PEZI